MNTRALKYPTLIENAIGLRGMLQNAWEFDALLRELDFIKAESILEIGSYKGGSTWCFLSQGYKVLSLDIDPTEGLLSLEPRFPETFASVKGDSQKAETTALVGEVLVSKLHTLFVDVLFIDGGHLADEALNDFNNYRDFLVKGGIAVFHDIVDSKKFRESNITVCDAWKSLRTIYPYKEFVCDANTELGERGIGILYL